MVRLVSRIFISNERTVWIFAAINICLISQACDKNDQVKIDKVNLILRQEMNEALCCKVEDDLLHDSIGKIKIEHVMFLCLEFIYWYGLLLTRFWTDDLYRNNNEMHSINTRPTSVSIIHHDCHFTLIMNYAIYILLIWN